MSSKASLGKSMKPAALDLPKKKIEPKPTIESPSEKNFTTAPSPSTSLPKSPLAQSDNVLETPPVTPRSPKTEKSTGAGFDNAGDNLNYDEMASTAAWRERAWGNTPSKLKPKRKSFISSSTASSTKPKPPPFNLAPRETSATDKVASSESPQDQYTSSYLPSPSTEHFSPKTMISKFPNFTEARRTQQTVTRMLAFNDYVLDKIEKSGPRIYTSVRRPPSPPVAALFSPIKPKDPKTSTFDWVNSTVDPLDVSYWELMATIFCKTAGYNPSPSKEVVDLLGKEGGGVERQHALLTMVREERKNSFLCGVQEGVFLCLIVYGLVWGMIVLSRPGAWERIMWMI